MEQEQHAHRVRFLTNIAYWAVIIAVIYFILKYFIKLIMPFFLAFIFAAIARPLAKHLSSETRRKKLKDGSVITVKRKMSWNYNISAVVSVIVVFILILGLVALIVSPVISIIIDFLVRVPDFYYGTIEPALREFVQNSDNLTKWFDGPMAEAVMSALPNLVSSLGSVVTSVSGKLLVWLSSIATSLPSALVNTLICLIATVFISLDFDMILNFITLNLKSNVLKMVIEIKDSLIDIVWQFIRSYFFIFLITTAEISLGLLIIGLKRPLLMGILIAIFDAFPIVGSGMILLPWALFTMINGSFWTGFAQFILYLVVVIVRQVIEPKIVGKHVGLRPIVTLICMFVGTTLFGGLGLFGLPISAAIIADLNESGVVKFFKTRATDPEPAEGPPEDGTPEDVSE